MRNLITLKKFLLACTLIFICNSGFSQTTISIPINTSSDDAEESISSGDIDLTSSDLEFCYDGGTGANDQYVGLRFQNITVPRGATISSAYIEFQVDETNSTPVTLNIKGIAVDNATTFTTAPYNISQRLDGTISSSTTANVNWSPANWPNIGDNGADQRTSNIATIVKELVDRGGWNSGNAMAFTLNKVSGSGIRIAESYNGTHNPTLYITYTAATGREINVMGNGINIPDGKTAISTTDDTDYGSVLIGSPVSHVFTIQNFGNTNLTISNPVISGHTSDFTVTANPTSPVAGGGISTFTVRFTPTTTGTRSATVTFANDDASENPYNFNIQGVGLTPSPEINLVGNGNNIADGDTATSTTNDTEFIGTGIGVPIDHTFTIQNTGTATLNLTGGAPLVSISGDPQFTITAQPAASTIAPAASRTFTVRFIPTDAGRKSATITIANNDSDENPYSFTVSGVNNLINSGGVWSYLDDGSDQGTAWYGTGFDYSGWASGPTRIGYGEGIEATVLATPSDPKPATVYFRRNFTITASDIASLKNTLVLNAIRDDGLVVYINGVEVWKDGMPATFDYTTHANQTIGGTDETTWITTSIANPFTVAGSYEIGVEIHQTNATSSDLGFDFEMYAANQLLPAGGAWSYLDDGSDQGTAWQTADVSPSGANWASGPAQLGFNEGDEATVIADNNQITTYFRKTITASGSDVTNSTLKISTIRDDGIVIYINGVEVLRNNMPVGPVNYNTLSFGDVTDSGGNNFEDFWHVFKIDNPLVAGSNEIAVEIHQFSATSDDVSFDLEFETNNDVIYVPTVKPDRDGDGREDYVDADDDNDGIADLVEGCYTTLPASLETDGDGETNILSSLPITTTLDDSNVIEYSVNNASNFTELTAYDAGEHGYGLRMRGPISDGQLTLDFTAPVKNLFFKLVDFDGHENIKVDVYDEFGVIVDLTTEEGLYHLGSYIEYIGSNTIREIYNGAAPNINNPENRAHDIYGGAYFYFPNISVSKVTLTANWASGNTIRLVGVQYCSKDTDGDGIDDFYDSDSDNDGIPDLVEVGGTDIDGDGIVDTFVDADNDGITALYDSNDNSYFIEERGTLTNLDFDGDGIRNNIDLDSDNDGILDIIEAGGVDLDGDGQIDGFTDTDDDGYHDAFDGTASSLLITGPDTNADGKPDSYADALDNPDNTGLPNFLDIDSDDDGITDHTEAQATAAVYVGFSGVDTDGDGILDVNDNSGTFGGNGFTPVDSDSDGIPDYIDTDSDNNGELDIIEGHDTNGDGTVNSSDWGTCLNSITSNIGVLSNVDTDGDGLDDGYDNDTVTYDPSNMGMRPTDHPNIDDIATNERDWREVDQEYNVIDFDGINDYIDFADNFDLTSSFSLEAWVKQDATSTGNGMIVSKRDCNKGTNLGYSFGLVNHFPNVKWYDNLGNLVFNLTSGHAIGTDRWYSLTVTYDNASTTAKIYIDGIEVASNSSVSAAPSPTDESLLVGAKFDDTDLTHKLSDEFKGWIDEVRIWDTALTPAQLRNMMNQEIQQNGSAVQGKILLTDVAGLNWTNLLGYYPMNSIVSGDLIDQSGYTRNGRIRNITTTQPQTAPLPYTTVADGDWDDVSATTPWTLGNSVWKQPNAMGIDGSTRIDWNIVQISHDIDSPNRNITVLGLISDTAGKTLTIANPSETLDENNTGQSLRVTNYLKLDGDIDLVGESQLLQDEGSILATNSSGTLERDQQGTQDLYTYNYWCSPVSRVNTSSNHVNYNIPEILSDGLVSASPRTINFISSGYNGTPGTPGITSIGIADYWIWKYSNRTSDTYALWQHVRSTGSLNVGEGFTMKGVASSGSSFTSTQNYVFKGKPNNGDITLPISAGNDYLVGNPYPSAIDADEFIKDNISTAEANGRNATGNVINGTLYFWDHFAKNTHILREYEGGYATYTLMGGAPAVNNDIRINATGAVGSKTPTQYIPVAQGFFVSAVLDADLIGDPNDPSISQPVVGGMLQFKNSQRIFVTEASAASTYFKSSNVKSSKTTATAAKVDTRQKIRLKMDSPSGYHRQLLAGVDDNASSNFDLGYDAPLIENNKEDMFWVFNNANFIIQAVDHFNAEQVLPLGVKINKAGLATIKIDALENMESNQEVYLHDKELNLFHDLKAGHYEVYLTPGTYLSRFEVTFSSKASKSLGVDDMDVDNLQVYYSNEMTSIIIHNPNLKDIKTIEIFNILGQSAYRFDSIETKNYSEFKTKPLNTGTYIINIKTTDGNTLSKKVLVNE